MGLKELIGEGLAHSRTAVIIPCYNEAEVLASTLAPVLASGYRVILVDDASTDQTASVARKLPVVYLRHAVNLGQGAALQTGVDYALEYTDAEILVHFDADGQHDPADIPAFTQTLLEDRFDVVLGSRFLRKDRQLDVPAGKVLLLQVARLVNFVFTGLYLTDAHNGFRAMTRYAASKIQFTENQYAHATEILWLIKKHGLRVGEQPTRVVYSEYSIRKGQRHYNAFNILFDLVLARLINK